MRTLCGFLFISIVIALVKQDIGNFELKYQDKITVLKASKPGLFLIGKFGEYAIFEYLQQDQNWVSNCDICDVENWASGNSELVIRSSSYKADAVYVSAISISKPITEIDSSMITIDYLPNSLCLYNCSGKGNCNSGYCNCLSGYAGVYCSISVARLPPNTELPTHLHPFKWEFFNAQLSDHTDFIHLELSDCTNGLHIYLDTSNGSLALPSFQRHKVHITFPQKKGILSRYYIEEQSLVLSLFCGKDEECSCKIKLEIKEGHHEKAGLGKTIAILSSMAVIFFIICSLGIIKLLKLCNSKYSILEEDRIISLKSMNLLFPSFKAKEKPGLKMGECIICLNMIEENEYVRVLGCMHSFHMDCIDHWTHINGKCPICKRALIRSENLVVIRQDQRRLSLEDIRIK